VFPGVVGHGVRAEGFRGGVELERLGGGVAQDAVRTELLGAFLDPEEIDDVGAGEGLALQAAADADAAVVEDDAVGARAFGLEPDELLQGAGDLVGGMLVLPPVGEDGVAEVGVDVAAGADEDGADELEPALEVVGSGLGADGVGVGGVADEIEHQQPAGAGVDGDGRGAGVGGGRVGGLLAAIDELDVADLEGVAVAQRGDVLDAQAVVVGAVGAAEVGEEVAAGGGGLEHGVVARDAAGLEDEGVGLDAADGAGVLVEPVHPAVGELQPGLGERVRHGGEGGVRSAEGGRPEG